jgi:NOT2/NOT3/NOT5 family protein
MTYNNKRVYTDSYGNQYIFVGTRQFAGAPTKGGGFFSKIGSFFNRGGSNKGSITTTSLMGASPKKTSFSKPLNTIRRQDTNKNTSFFKSKSTTNTNNSKTTDWFSANKSQQNKSIPGAGANPTKPMGETPTQAKLNKEQKRQENKNKNIQKRAEEQARKDANKQRVQQQQNKQSSQQGWGNRQQKAGVGSQQNQSTVSVEAKNNAGFVQNPSQKGRMNESKTFIPTNQNANPSATVENAAALRSKGTQQQKNKPVVNPNANANPTSIVEKAQQTHQQTQKSIIGAGANNNQTKVNKTVVQQPRPDSVQHNTSTVTPPPQPKPQQQPQAPQPNPTPTPQPVTSQPNTNTAFDKAKAQRDANIAQFEKNKAEGKSATTGETLNYWGDKVAQKFDNAPSAGDVLKGTKDAVSTGVKEGVRRTANIIGGKKRWDKFHEEYAAARNGAEKTAAVLRGTGNGLLGVAKRGITGAAIAGAGALAVGGLATAGAISAGKRVLRAGANAAGSAVGAIKQAMPNPQQHPQPQPAPGTVPQAVVHHYH